ncbi:MAG TPA: pyridoxamine 5'-phosphate oxidase family protein, partial [Acidimicrobiales bacterium]|nr:pyridoxamine 5'-phosphate oxidase family protein [Acidimicrobiales bacterium]
RSLQRQGTDTKNTGDELTPTVLNWVGVGEEEVVSITMSDGEREAFLADVHVGVLSVSRPSHGPLAVPVWYTYTAGGTVSFITEKTSRKSQLIVRAGRFSLCAQTETAPYKYVSVEGPVTSIEDRVDPDERRALAYRYLGPEFGDLYLAATEADAETNCVIRMTPESWLSADFAKEFGGS